MSLDRRDCLKVATTTAGSLLLPIGALAESETARFPLHKKIMEGRSICPYCSVGCGVIIATDPKGHVINTEGDPDHPINRGALDPRSVGEVPAGLDPALFAFVMAHAFHPFLCACADAVAPLLHGEP